MKKEKITVRVDYKECPTEYAGNLALKGKWLEAKIADAGVPFDNFGNVLFGKIFFDGFVSEVSDVAVFRWEPSLQEYVNELCNGEIAEVYVNKYGTATKPAWIGFPPETPRKNNPE